MKVYIYVLKHPVTLEVRYVGLTRFPVKRLNNEINYPHTKHLRNWVNSLKIQGLNPSMEVIEESEEGAACDTAERKWIAEMKSRGCRLINFTNGGERGYKCSDEYRRAVSEGQRGKVLGPMSAEHKAKISAANKGRQFNPNSGTNFSVLNRSRIGIPLRDETKKKLSEIGKGFVTGEWRENVIRANQNRKHASKFTDEQKAEIKFLIADGYSHKVIADKYGMAIGTVSCIKRDQMWCDIGPAESVLNPPEFKSVPLFRNDKGQYKRTA
jgi:hypothetical protein